MLGKVEKRSQEGFVSYYKERYKDDFPRLPVSVCDRPLNRPHAPPPEGWGALPADKAGAVMLSLPRFLSIGCGMRDRNSGFLTHWKKRINKLLGKNRAAPALFVAYGLPETID